MTRTRLLCAILGAAALCAGGCGYSYGLPDKGPRRVAIEVVRNDSFRQRLERPLNRELYRALAAHSGMVPSSREDADVVLLARISEIYGDAIVRGGQGPTGAPVSVREGALTYSVSVQLLDADSGAILREAEFQDRAEFRIPVLEDETTANQEAARDIARRIVLALEADF